MFTSLMRLFETPIQVRPPHTRLSVAVLLMEAARQDDKFDSSERQMIEKLLSQRFQLTSDECFKLMAAAEHQSRQLTQMHGHTCDIAHEMSPDERVAMIEMLWEVAYADGVLDPEEDLLIRRIASLIYVTDRDRVLARQRVLARVKHDSN